MNPATRAQHNQTIAAQSTAKGTGAIAIVRISGVEAFDVAQKLGCQSDKQRPYKLVRVALSHESTGALDDALVAFMPGPNSYTGEDLVELHVHGGEAVVAAVLRACLVLGARPAAAGEFTLRAFAHGRLDLAQAEAIGALIHAQTDGARTRALAVLGGALSNQVGQWLHRLEGVAASWLSQMDFPDDTLDACGASQAERSTCAAACAALEALWARMAQEEERAPHVVLMGAVNTGKSTLTNAFAGYERAIVDASAGTTRDTIEVPLRHRQQRFNLWDTAGERAGATGVEAQGIRLGRAQAEQAALVLWLCDAACPLWPPKELSCPFLLIGAQADRYDAAQRAAFEAAAKTRGLSVAQWISGRTQEGIDVLRERICVQLQTRFERQGLGDGAEADGMANLRHKQQLQLAIEGLQALAQGVAQGQPLDLLLTDLQHTVRALGQIVGRDVDAQVIDRIFKDFCIGK